MNNLDPRITDRIRGPAWSEIRDKFIDLSERVLAVSPRARAELTTIYVKFAIDTDPTAPVYAVAWLKSAKNVVIGFALPEATDDAALISAPTGMMYKGITKYLRVLPDAPLPDAVTEWARVSFADIVARTDSAK
jgi:hypothetical protein